MPTLQDLPLELRQKIYSLALVEPGSVIIDTYNAANREIRDRVVGRGHKRNPKRRGEVYYRRARAWVPYQPITQACLFRVNKQTLVEAAPMFYGGNNFMFEHTRALERFLNQIGQNKKHLRYVQIEYYGYSRTKSASPRAFGALVAAKDFRSLIIEAIDLGVYDYRTQSFQVSMSKVEALVKHCKPLLQYIKASYEAKSLRFNVMDVISIGTCCSFCRKKSYSSYSFHSADDVAVFGEVGRSVKKEIARQLELGSSDT